MIAALAESLHILRARDVKRFSVGAPMAEKELAALEKKSGVSLPPKYRSYVLQIGDGGAGFPETAGLRKLKGLRSLDARVFDAKGRNPSHGCLLLGEDDLGHDLWLVLSGPQADSVWADGQSDEGGRFQRVGDFLALTKRWVTAQLKETKPPELRVSQDKLTARIAKTLKGKTGDALVDAKFKLTKEALKLRALQLQRATPDPALLASMELLFKAAGKTFDLSCAYLASEAWLDALATSRQGLVEELKKPGLSVYPDMFRANVLLAAVAADAKVAKSELRFTARADYYAGVPSAVVHTVRRLPPAKAKAFLAGLPKGMRAKVAKGMAGKSR